MARITVIGAGLAGMSAAYGLRQVLGREHPVTVVGQGPRFAFTPSNPWIGIGWRKSAQTMLEAGPLLRKRDIAFHASPATRIDAAGHTVQLADGQRVDHDYLVVCTGPKPDFAAIPGLGPEAGFSQSVCTAAHAERAFAQYMKFVRDPGPVVVGAVQGGSCFGPACEFAFILDADLRARRTRDRVPMTYVTSEPFVGHLGLGGVGDSRGLMESELRRRDIRWITNAGVVEVRADAVVVQEHDGAGQPSGALRTLPAKYSMLLPAFAGVDVVAAVEGLCDPRGFVNVDRHQRSTRYPEIFAAGACVAIAQPEPTSIPTGVPTTGIMVESMVTTVVRNIEAELAGRPARHEVTLNAVCLADMGDGGAAFVALPQMPPRTVTWAKASKRVHVAKIAFEKHFLFKMRRGSFEPVYERHVLGALGMEHLQDPANTEG